MYKCDIPTPLAREMDLLCVHKVLKTLMQLRTKAQQNVIILMCLKIGKGRVTQKMIGQLPVKVFILFTAKIITT